jgi:hypothetical protein
MRKIMMLMVTLAMVLSLAVAAQATTIYTNYGSFLAAFPGPTVENFEDTILQPGLTITDTNPGAVIADGVYKSLVNSFYGYTTTFTNSSNFCAFGGWFDLTPGGAGTGIKITVVDTGEVIGEVPRTYAGEFWGFSTGTPFSSVMFSQGSDPLGSQETYWAVDLAYKTCPVPLPPSALLMGSGLLGLVGLGWRRSRKES